MPAHAVLRQQPAGFLKLAGIAMGEAVEEAIDERVVAHGELPPPGEER